MSAVAVNPSTPGIQFRIVGLEDAQALVQTPVTRSFNTISARSCLPEGKSSNHLYIGDNLDALKALRSEYENKVKLCYIDPPYNTGDIWIYEDGRSTAAWLHFMYPRLVLARELLRPDGVIFISIGEEELASLRMLCDHIFGIQNRISVASWRRRHNQPNDVGKMVAQVAEFVLIYGKNVDALRSAGTYNGVPLSERRQAQYTNPDNDPRGPWTTKPWKAASGQSGSFYRITSPTGVNYEHDWLGAEETFQELLQDGRIAFSRNGAGLPRKKIFLSERMAKGQPPTNFWTSEQWGHNQEATEEQARVFGGVKQVFTAPKPVRLIKRIVRIAAPSPGDVVLDLFAGSGTTAEAVWRQCAEDGIERSVLLVQLDEPIEPHRPAHKAAASLGYTSIDQVMEARLRALSGELKGLASWHLHAQ